MNTGGGLHLFTPTGLLLHLALLLCHSSPVRPPHAQESLPQAARVGTEGSVLALFYTCTTQGVWRRLVAFFCNGQLLQNKSLFTQLLDYTGSFLSSKSLKRFAGRCCCISTAQNLSPSKQSSAREVILESYNLCPRKEEKRIVWRNWRARKHSEKKTKSRA